MKRYFFLLVSFAMILSISSCKSKDAESEYTAVENADTEYIDEEAANERWDTSLLEKHTVAAGYYHTVAIQADGTVLATGQNEYGECNVADWKNIVSIYADQDQTIGITADGEFLTAGELYLNETLSKLQNTIQIDVGFGVIAAVRDDGTAVCVGTSSVGATRVDDWTDIVSIATNGSHTVGVKGDGTVVATGSNTVGQCDVAGWSNIIKVSTGYLHTVGLKSDGTVVAVGDNDDQQCNVTDWDNVIDIKAGRSFTVGLKADGSVIYAGRTSKGWLSDLDDWNDIVEIDAASTHVVGVKADGTIVAVGEQIYGICAVADWSTAKVLPVTNDALLAESLDADNEVFKGESYSGMCGENLTWSLDKNGTLEISGIGNMTDYYREDDYLEPENSYSIGNHYFNGGGTPWKEYASLVNEVLIDAGVTSISPLAFAECVNLTSITIPASVETIGLYAFFNCLQLNQIDVNPDNTCYKSDNGILFDKTGEVLIQYPCNRDGPYVIPDSVLQITEGAFDGCDKLSEISLPGQMTEIESRMFYGCDNLISVTIPEGVETIRSGAFSNCKALENVSLPSTLKQIEDSAFNTCTKLSTIRIPEGVTELGNDAFNQCFELTSVYLPTTLTRIGQRTFARCESVSVYYAGSEENWSNVIIKDGNNDFLYAPVYFDYEY